MLAGNRGGGAALHIPTPISHSPCLPSAMLPLQMAWCSTPDIGGVAAAAIVGGPGKHGGARLGVAGEHASVQEVADTFGKVFGKKVGGLEGGLMAGV